MDYFRRYFVDILKFKYADFGVRAIREEFWYYALFWTITFIFLPILGNLLRILGIMSYPILSFGIIGIYFIGTIIPYLALVSRRLHDTGKSGLWWLIRFVPLGNIVLLVFYYLDSERGPNKWGHSPKYNQDENKEDGIYNRHLIDDDLL